MKLHHLKIRMLSTALCLLIVISVISTVGMNVSAEYPDEIYDPATGLSYIIADGDARITNCEKLADNVVIPETLGGSAVTAIGDYAFGNENPENACSNLQYIFIPESVTTIGTGAFYNCVSLQNIMIPGGVDWIPYNAFMNCSSLNTVIIESGVTGIGPNAFFGCTNLYNVYFPDTVTDITSRAFASCSKLTSFSIPNSVTFLANDAFIYDSMLTTILVAPDNAIYSSIDGVVYSNSGNSQTLYLCPAGRTGHFTVPNSVAYIGDGAFYTCGQLTGITISDSVLDIGSYAFRYCNELSSVTFEGVVNSIGFRAFEVDYESSSQMSFLVPYGAGTTYNTLLSSAVLGTTTATITEMPSNNFIVSASPNNTAYGTVTGSGEYVSGSTVTLNAIPNAGCVFFGWMDGTTPISAENVYSFTASEDRTLVATFTKLPVPTGIVASSASYNSIKLSWNVAAGMTGSIVYCSTSPDSGFTQILSTTGTNNTFTGLSTGTKYYFKVCTYLIWNGTGTFGEQSSVVNAIPVPGTPTNLLAIAASKTSVKLSWTATPGATGYSIYRSIGTSGTYTLLTSTTSLSYINKTLSKGITYNYRIAAYTMVGTTKVYGATSSPVSFRL